MDWIQIGIAFVGFLLVLAGALGRRKSWFAILVGIGLIIASVAAWPFIRDLAKTIGDPIFHASDWSVYIVVRYTDNTTQRVPNTQPQMFVTMDKTKCIKQLEWHLTKPPFTPGSVTAKLWLYWTGHKFFGKDIMGKTIWEKTVTVQFRNGTDAVAYVMPYSELREAVESNILLLQIPFVNQWDTMELNMGADIGEKKLNYEHAITLYVSSNDNIIKCSDGSTQPAGVKIVSVVCEYGTQAIVPQAVDPNAVEQGSSLSTAFVSLIASIVSVAAGIATLVRK